MEEMKCKTHLDELPIQEADAFREVISELRRWPDLHVSEGFSGRVMAALDAQEEGNEQRPAAAFRRSFQIWSCLRAAACVVLALGGIFYVVNRLFRRPVAPAPKDIAWLASVQDPSGFWDPVRHGGSAAYRSALTALSALALSRAPNHAHDGSIRRACRALASAQRPSGAFSAEGRSGQYNHAITTFALASLATRCPEAKPLLSRAVAFIRASQSASGGWGYTAGSPGDTALTAWNLCALASANKQGVPEAKIPLCKGLRWIRNTLRAEGRLVCTDGGRKGVSESLTALTAFALLEASGCYPELEELGRAVVARLSADASAGSDGTRDCYRDYAKVLALNAAGAGARARALSERLLRSPVRDLRDDAWGSAGGYLYTRALTILSQR